MPLVEGGACRQGEPGKPPQFIDAIANKGYGPNARTSTANRIATAAVCHPEAANLFCARSSRPNRFKYQIKMIYACL
jgi:hypothetical protein